MEYSCFNKHLQYPLDLPLKQEVHSIVPHKNLFMSTIRKNENLLRLQEISLKTVLSFNDALVYLDLSKSSLYKLTSDNKIVFSKPNGGKIYFKKEDLDLWLLGNKTLDVSSFEKGIDIYLKKGKK